MAKRPPKKKTTLKKAAKGSGDEKDQLRKAKAALRNIQRIASQIVAQATPPPTTSRG